MGTIAELHELIILDLVFDRAPNRLRHFLHEVVVEVSHWMGVNQKPLLVNEFKVPHLLLA